MPKWQLKEGNGSLFPSDRKETENHPDWNGSIMVNGVEHWFSAWDKTSQSGMRYLSVSIGRPKQNKGGTTKPTPPKSEDLPFDDDIPF